MHYLKFNVIFFQSVGALFFIKSFQRLSFLNWPNDFLEFLRSPHFGLLYGSSSSPFFTDLYFINLIGLLGLFAACALAYSVCRKLKFSGWNVILVFIIALLVNKLFMDILKAFPYKSTLLERFSLHTLLLANILIALIIGVGFILFPFVFKYFKYANPGGIRSPTNKGRKL
jgi:hypothetical protein